jgi:hypothetical protein
VRSLSWWVRREYHRRFKRWCLGVRTGVSYFECRPKHGLMTLVEKLQPANEVAKHEVAPQGCAAPAKACRAERAALLTGARVQVASGRAKSAELLSRRASAGRQPAAKARTAFVEVPPPTGPGCSSCCGFIRAAWSTPTGMQAGGGAVFDRLVRHNTGSKATDPTIEDSARYAASAATRGAHERARRMATEQQGQRLGPANKWGAAATTAPPMRGPGGGRRPPTLEGRSGAGLTRLGPCVRVYGSLP